MGVLFLEFYRKDLNSVRWRETCFGGGVDTQSSRLCLRRQPHLLSPGSCSFHGMLSTSSSTCHEMKTTHIK